MDENATPEFSTLARLEQRLLGGPRTVSLAELAARVGADVDLVRSFWHGLGVGTGDPDVPAFTEGDVRLLGLFVAMRDRWSIDDAVMVSVVRSAGHMADRLVTWQGEALVEHVADRYDLDDASARVLFLDRLEDALPVLELQLLHAWRHHMAGLAARFTAEFVVGKGGGRPTELPLTRAVGFADMVAFTARTARMSTQDLSHFVQEYETRSRDAVTAAGGRVIKTVGDAVLFVADDVETGAAVALSLVETFGARSAMPVRVGMVLGRILSRFGDVFGTPVNLAARLTKEAEPGCVLVDELTAALLADRPDLRLETQPERVLPGVGPRRPVRLTRA